MRVKKFLVMRTNELVCVRGPFEWFVTGELRKSEGYFSHLWFLGRFSWRYLSDVDFR